MKEKTKQLLNKVGESHDWISGRPFSNGGTELHWTDECQICGLRKHFKKDPQNGDEGHYRFSRGGCDMTLLDAANIKCC